MSTRPSPRSNLLLPWAVQEREDPVLEFDQAEGMYFFDRQGRRYLDFVSQVFHCTLGHGNRRVIEAIVRQAERHCCVSPQMLTADRAALAAEPARHSLGNSWEKTGAGSRRPGAVRVVYARDPSLPDPPTASG